MLVLGIDTTCDDTSFAVVKDGVKILSNIIASQTKLHEGYQGVFPEMAAREHLNNLIPTLQRALCEANIRKEDLELIAVAKEPGLIGSLLVGMSCAKALSLSLKIPYVGVNHVEAHLYAALMQQEAPFEKLFPALGIVLSGGHTFITWMEAPGVYKKIASTVDDAIGEAFDKVAVLMGLPYPGGVHIEEQAKRGDPKRYPFPSGKVKENPWDFSFSGIKTSVLYTLKGKGGTKESPSLLDRSEHPHIAASFQETVFGEILARCKKALLAFPVKTIFFGGGVTQNERLRELFIKADLRQEGAKVACVFCPKELCLDNGAMIAGLGYQLYQQKREGDSLSLVGRPRGCD